MLSKNLTKLAIASAILVAPLAQAYAYSIHKKDGEYTIECDNGVRSTGSTLQVTHAEAEHFCKVRGSSISTGNDPKPATDVKAKAKAVPQKQVQNKQ